MVIKLYYYGYVESYIGVWTREWFATEAEAVEARRIKIEELGDDANCDEGDITGEYGDVDSVTEEGVELTPAGLIAFANRHAGIS